MIEHAKIRPPRGAAVIAVFDLDTWGDTDDGEQHHAFLTAGDGKTGAIAYVASCRCQPMSRECPRTKIMFASRAFFDSLTIIERTPKLKRPIRVRRLARR